LEWAVFYIFISSSFLYSIPLNHSTGENTTRADDKLREINIDLCDFYRPMGYLREDEFTFDCQTCKFNVPEIEVCPCDEVEIQEGMNALKKGDVVKFLERDNE